MNLQLHSSRNVRASVGLGEEGATRHR